MTPTFEVKATVLEDKGKQTFVADGKSIEYRNALVRIGSTVVRVKMDKEVDLTAYLDSEVTLKFEIRADQKLSAFIRVVGIDL